jgi:hypothetical protein
MARFEDSGLAIGWSGTTLVMGRSSGQCHGSGALRDTSPVPLAEIWGNSAGFYACDRYGSPVRWITSRGVSSFLGVIHFGTSPGPKEEGEAYVDHIVLSM